MKYDVAAFLESLFRQLPEGAASAPDLRIEDLDPDWRVEWEERAFSIERDGGQPRERAEAFALADVAGRIHRGERVGCCSCPACRVPSFRAPSPPTPPPGAFLCFQDVSGRPCERAAAHLWSWEGAAAWHFVGDCPPPMA